MAAAESFRPSRRNSATEDEEEALAVGPDESNNGVDEMVTHTNSVTPILSEMAVHCSECGEEVLGAANRCWRCGREFRMSADAEGKPPIRRNPVELSRVVVPSIDESGEPPDSELASTPSTKTEPAEPVPGADSEAPVIELPTNNERQRNDRQLRTRQLFGLFAGISALLIAMLAVSAVSYSWWSQRPLLLLPALMASLLGIGLGIGTLNSRGRVFAMVALLLSIAALAIAGFFLLIELYGLVVGVHPFLEPPTVIEPNDVTDDLLDR